jgi:ferredoxin
MEALRKKARELLESKAVQVVIGYGEGSVPDRARALFIRKPDQAAELILDDRCRPNLAVYLIKNEVKALGKAAIVAQTPTLRTILQLASENQLADGLVVALAVNDGQVIELTSFQAIEEYLTTAVPAAEGPGKSRGLSAEDRQAVEKISAMSREQRWQYWVNEFSRCMKCYACRAACPMCYCTRCVIESNQPQWIPVAPTGIGNLEWHVVRAMHLAGRCLNCGYCAEACPVGIRLNLLTQTLTDDITADFGVEAGFSAKREFALSTFKPEDKEDFIR